MSDALQEQHTGAEAITWDLSVFYQGLDDPQMEADIAKLKDMVDAFQARWRGKVAEMNAADFVSAYQAMEAIYDLRGRLGSFAFLNFSTDTGDSDYQAAVARVQELEAALSQKMVFFDLEWNALDDEAAQVILDDPVLAQYRYYLEAERRYRPYNLSEAEEQIIIEKSVTGSGAWTRFFTQLTSAFRFDWMGEEVNMTFVLNKLRDADRDAREMAWRKLTDKLGEKSMELTFIFNTLALDKANSDRRRGYASWVSSRNLSNKASDEVVEALVATVTGNYELVARHYRLKRALLEYDELYDYDRYAPLNLKESEAFYLWDQARDIVLNAFKNFSPRMKDEAQAFFDQNWIHAPVLPNKRGGAFAAPTVASANPYVFLNYLGDTRDVTTLAHELGHGIHMTLSGKANGLFALHTPLTTAEMASTFAEMLVFQDLMAAEDDDEVKLSMLIEKIEDTFATVFRQISMNRFEDKMHKARRQEGELTAARFNELWLETQRDMFGDSIIITEEYGSWWSYVPHFLHAPGYVYAYSFGELLVLALYKLYEEEGQGFVPKYIDLLAAGDSDYPDRLLANIGVDINDAGFWQKGIDVIEEWLRQAESLSRRLYPKKFA
ncbi:MAG: M3 family oligoendopeptidase [Chloroflexota bacterium]|nr:M3 family oligoendopeptidase [Chloroflexota bacterium]MDE2946845.1 M3 family oligoendopeptidase [Chloroflexota bacterium]